MGLDIIALVPVFERTFHVEMPPVLGSGLSTPRQTIAYLATQLPMAPAERCLAQQVFYRLRRALRAELGAGLVVRPATKLRKLVKKHEWPELYDRICAAVGDQSWPQHIPWRGWLKAGPATLGELTIHIAMHSPPPNALRGERWTRERIELTLRRVVWETLGVQRFSLDEEYTHEVGFD